MIRINLKSSAPTLSSMTGTESPSDIQVQDTDIQRQGLFKLIVLLIVPLALYVYEIQLIPDLQSRLASKNNTLQALTEKNEQARGAVEEIKKFKEDQAKLQKQIDTLERLQKERLREVKILDNLQKDIPEKVWLSKMDFQETKLVIHGLTTADSELTQFMENLSRSVFFEQVNLVRSTEQAAGKSFLRSFEISCAIDQSFLKSASTNEVGR